MHGADGVGRIVEGIVLGLLDGDRRFGRGRLIRREAGGAHSEEQAGQEPGRAEAPMISRGGIDSGTDRDLHDHEGKEAGGRTPDERSFEKNKPPGRLTRRLVCEGSDANSLKASGWYRTSRGRWVRRSC